MAANFIHKLTSQFLTSSPHPVPATNTTTADVEYPSPLSPKGSSGWSLPFLVDDYNGRLDSIRQSEYPQLFEPASLAEASSTVPQLKTVFLDHAGSTLYAASHIRAHADGMLSHIPANPHSRHAESQWTQAKIDYARDRLLAFFGTSAREYAVVFTANATAAIRIAGELAPMDPAGGVFCYTQAAHTSVVGLRNIAAEKGVSVRPAAFSDIYDIVAPQNTHGCSLLAYPAQCNFSGEKFSLDVAERIHQLYKDAPQDNGTDGHLPWWVLVDAASYAATSPLSLDVLPVAPDFIAVSMYKIFGAPTGLGALLIKRSSIPYLSSKRHFFGGGTVTGVVFDRQWQRFRHDVESRLEDGTVNFQDIISLHHALDAYERNYGSIHTVNHHIQSVTRYSVAKLQSLRHSNGMPICQIYGHSGGSDFGPVIAFNVKDAQTRFVGYVEVERLAVMFGIALRSGRFCNPGAAQRWLELDSDDIVRFSSLGFVCGDDHDLVNGRPLGALRISFGAMTSKLDVDLFADFLVRHFKDYMALDCKDSDFCTSSSINAGALSSDEIDSSKAIESSSPASAITISSQVDNTLQIEIDQVAIYPVKSCHGWTVPANMNWEVTRYGLKFDRSFIIMRENSTFPMQQKRNPKMALIRTAIDVQRLILTLEFPGLPPLEISLCADDLCLQGMESRVCGDSMHVSRIMSDEISSWLSSALSVSCYLACDQRLLWANTACGLGELSDMLSDSATIDSADIVYPSCNRRANISFANEAQILLVTLESAQQVEDWIAEDSSISSTSPASLEIIDVDPMQYRPNIIVKSTSAEKSRAIQPFEELDWSSLSIGPGMTLDVSGPCTRCKMISIDQNSAKTLKTPYSTLARRMRIDGKVVFGIYLDLVLEGENNPFTISSGKTFNVVPAYTRISALKKAFI
ncbi:hypothetical protein GGI26_000017 [Coemansia sp. RSA 1358]|nr:hypothetical protein EDC05_000200 [Coemansia umbellata]KAJ2625933.1 hypothetical protein GGI26_000017 [Coemansia sp. RSA 1358]